MTTRALIASIVLLAGTSHAAPVDRDTHNSANPGAYPAVNLLDTTTDILGAPFAYPDCPPRIHSDIITLQPQATGSEHTHETPMYAHILSGQLSVNYASGVNRTYRAGDTLVEAMHILHHGFNDSDEPASLLVVYMDCQKEAGK